MTPKPDCTHGKPLHCTQCEAGVDDYLEACVILARRKFVGDKAAAVIAEALLREAGMPYLDAFDPESAAEIAVSALREANLLLA